MSNNLKFFLMGVGATIVTITLFMTISNSWKLGEEETKIRLQEELHQKAIGNTTFKKSEPLDYMKYTRSPDSSKE